MPTTARAAALGTLLVVALTGCSGHTPDTAGQREVRVAVAADLRFAFDDVVAEFQRGHSDIHVEVSYGSSGNFFAQLTNQAPFDLFLSADLEYPRRLIDANVATQ